MNEMEFYSVVFYDGDEFYFKNRGHAFSYLWNEFLDSLTGRESTEYIEDKRIEMNETYMIENFGMIRVLGFED